MTDQTVWQTASFDATIDHILQRYHDIHRRQFDDILPLAEKVSRVHEGKISAELLPLVQHIAAELSQHMMKEERMLFPMIKQGVGRGAAMPISVMMHEHEDHEQALARLAALTDQFTPPADACRSWRSLYEQLAQFAADLRAHIDLENNILFPRVLAS